MHEVRDALSNDARMVPLLRLMARYADASARGQQLPISSPADAHPFTCCR